MLQPHVPREGKAELLDCAHYSGFGRFCAATNLGPPVVPFHQLFGESSPTNIDYRKDLFRKPKAGSGTPKWLVACWCRKKRSNTKVKKQQQMKQEKQKTPNQKHPPLRRNRLGRGFRSSRASHVCRQTGDGRMRKPKRGRARGGRQ